MNPRTTGPLLAVLVAIGVAAFLSGYGDPKAWVVVVGLIGLGAVFFVGTTAQGPRLGDLAEAARTAARGRAPRVPANATPEVTDFYSQLTEVSSDVSEREAEAKARSKEVDALREQLETLKREKTQWLGERDALVAQADSGGPGKEVIPLVRELSDLSATVSDDAVAAQTGATQILEQSHTMGRAVNEVLQSLEMLATSAEESSSSLLEMTTTNEEVSENIAELATSVRETVSSIEEMAYSIREVARNVDALSLTAEETSSSMNEMDVSIDQVQSNANETARLSEEVALDADRGAEAILKTISEIYRIKESSQEAVSVISTLGTRIEAIGQILAVIDDVAEQTNLLALNAAIIAAQAGEHGKGFAVVADEIKDLAERAGGSTKEIAELIKTIQSESKNAISAVERGAVNVSRGVEVSNEAERALKKILESSQKSTTMVRAIARATVEQAKGSKQVTDSIGRIAETVQQIAAATAQQARGSDLIMKSAEKMRMITQHVERSSQEQSRGGKQITEAIEQISSMVNAINASHRNRGNGQDLIDMARAIDERVRAQNKALARMKLLGERIGVSGPK